jgi:hypothetical protein
LYGRRILRKLDYRKEELKKDIAGFTYKSTV